MIQTKIQFNLKSAKQYFREHLCAGDYYSGGQKISGEWLGFGAEKLGLKGAVGQEAFVALCEGRHPETGLRLGQRLNSIRHEGDDVKANRRLHFDFTIAPPKSVSVVALFQDARILGIHEQAVQQTMLELERRAEARVRKSRQDSERVTGNLVAACFRHETSRELDPLLHTHCVVFNATFDPVENCWKALDPAGMYRAHRFGTNFYRHELCKGLRALGYEIEHHTHGFEIKGVPQSVINRFSKRHRQIDEETRERLEKGERVGNIKDLRERVAHGNRRRKLKNSTAERLRSAWGAEMLPEELVALRALESVKPHAVEKADLPGILAWADEYLFERRAVVHDHELMAAALERGRGMHFDLAALRLAIDRRGYLREKDSDKLTTREVMGWELEVVVAAHDGRNRHAAMNPDYRASAALSLEQAAAVGKILRSRDFITLFRGAGRLREKLCFKGGGARSHGGGTREEVRNTNEAIRAKLREAGKLGAGAALTTYQPADLGEAQKRDSRYYQAGHRACFIRGYGRFARGEICPIVGANERGVILEKNGVRSAMSYRYADRFAVAIAKETEIAVGDRLQLKFNGKSVEGTRLNNGELITVSEVAPDGSLVVEARAGTRKTLAPTQRLLVRGFCVTSYGSQGKTVDTVILADAANRSATDAHQWYVSISRGRKRVLVFTPDKEALRLQVQQAGERELAMDLKVVGAPSVDLRQTEWTRRSITAGERLRQSEVFEQMKATTANHQHIHQ